MYSANKADVIWTFNILNKLLFMLPISVINSENNKLIFLHSQLTDWNQQKIYIIYIIYKIYIRKYR